MDMNVTSNFPPGPEKDFLAAKIERQKRATTGKAAQSVNAGKLWSKIKDKNECFDLFQNTKVGRDRIY